MLELLLRANRRERPRWRGASVATLAITAAVLVASCADTPTASVTATLTQGGATIQMVVKSDSAAIAAIEAKPYANDPSFAVVTFTNGDSHSGTRLCGFTVSNSQHTYQVDFYGTVRPAGIDEVCSAAAQTHFLATAP
jgi:hypothetical protein